MSHYTLSRSSRTYKFVFGKEEGKLEGFPEPKNDSISLGLFFGLFLLMALLSPLMWIIMLFMEAMFIVVGFLMDGSYARGSLVTGLKIKKIEPWPKMFGRRVSPWLVLAVLAVGYNTAYGDWERVWTYLFLFGFTTLIFLSIQPGDKSPSEQFADAIEPVMDEKLHLAYYRQPKYFPTLYLVK